MSFLSSRDDTRKKYTLTTNADKANVAVPDQNAILPVTWSGTVNPRRPATAPNRLVSAIAMLVIDSPDLTLYSFPMIVAVVRSPTTTPGIAPKEIWISINFITASSTLLYGL